jgi:hypothetical protein
LVHNGGFKVGFLRFLLAVIAIFVGVKAPAVYGRIEENQGCLGLDSRDTHTVKLKYVAGMFFILPSSNRLSVGLSFL